MCARKIKKSYRSCVGYFKSYKNDKQIAFESILERDCFTFLEFEKNVMSYKEQPFTINYKLNGTATRYTPDVLVTYNDGSKKVFEVKYQNDIDTDPELQEKLNVLSKEIQLQTGYSFEVFTDTSFEDIYLKNCNFLYNFAFLGFNEDHLNKIIETFAKCSGSVSVKEFLEMMTGNPDKQLQLQPYFWHMIFKNPLLVDMSKKLTMSSMIYPKENYG